MTAKRQPMTSMTTAHKVATLLRGVTEYPLQLNYLPDAAEILTRLAVHILTTVSNDTYVILMFDAEKSVYLEAFIPPESEDEEDGDGTVTPRPLGTVEYIVCDGLPGDRSGGVSHYTLAEAIAEFRETVAHGWPHQRRAKPEGP